MRTLYLLLFFVISSCSLIKKTGREITINSQPKDAEVSYLTADGEFKVIGKTPLKVSESTIKEWLKSGKEYAVIRVSKSGFVLENLFIDLNSRYKLSYTSGLKPIDVWNEKEMEISSHSANKLAKKIQQINQLIFNKKFDTALKSTEGLIDQFPKAHVFYDIKGSLLVLMGRSQEAVASYQKSLALNPDNSEAKMMLERVKGERQ